MDSTEQVRSNMRTLVSMAIAAFVGAGCVTPGEFIAGSVIMAVEGTHRLVEDGEVSDCRIEGHCVGTHEGVPTFGEPKGLRICFSYAFPRYLGGVKHQTVWRRGRQVFRTTGKIAAGGNSLSFPLKDVRSVLGDNWAGRWEVDLTVKGEHRAVVHFNLANPEQARKLLRLAQDAEIRGDDEAAAAYRSKALQCDPLTR